MADIGAKISIDGEKQFRQDLQNITQQGKTLAAEMDKVSTAFRNADDSEKDMSKVTETLNKQIENQRKLVDKLKAAVENSAKKTGENSTETLKWKEKLAKAEKGLNDLEKKSKDAANGVDILGKEEKETSNQTSIFGDVLKSNLASEAIKKGIQALSSAVKDVAKFFVEAVKESAAYADEVNTLSKTTGMSTDAIQEWKYAADLIDVSFETIEGSLTKLTKNMDAARDGSKKQAQAFETLGVSVTDANGNLRDSNEVFDDVLAALREIDNPTERDAIAMDLLGKSAKDLNPLIETSADDLAAIKREAHDVGAVMGRDTLSAMSKVQDGFDRLSGTWDAVKKSLGAKVGIAILPDLQKFVDIFQSFAKTGNIGDFAKRALDTIGGLLKKLGEKAAGLIKDIPKLLSKIGDSKIWIDFADSIGKLLGEAIKNAPKILAAGVKLGLRLIAGIFQVIPNLVKALTGAFEDSEFLKALKARNNELSEIRDRLDDIRTASEKTESAFADINAKRMEAQRWIDIFEKISQKTDPTVSELNAMKTAVEKLNELYPELGLAADKETGKWNMTADEIRRSTDNLTNYYKAQAYYAAASESYQDLAKTELDLAKAREIYAAARKDYEERTRYGTPEAEELLYVIGNYTKAYQTVKDLEEKQKELNNDIEFFNAQAAEMATGYEQQKEAAEFRRQIESEMNDLDKFLVEKHKNLQKRLQRMEDDALQGGRNTGKALGQGVDEGLDSMIGPVTMRASGMITSAINRMKAVAQIHSPSKVTEDLIGKNLALGVIEGWEDVFDSTKMRNAFSMRGAIGAMSGSVANTTNTTNLGGVSVNVYARDGESTNEIAEKVMRKIQTATDARKAVFA